MRSFPFSTSSPLLVSSPSEVTTPYVGQIILADKFPRVASLPVTVVNGMSYVLTTTETEYIGVGGSWVAQGGKTKGMWKYRTVGNFENDFVLAPLAIWRNDEATEVELLVYLDFSSANNSKLIAQIVNYSMNIAFNGTQLKYDLYGIGSGNLGSVTPSCWRRIKFVTNASKDLTVYLDGVLFSSYPNLTSWTGNPTAGNFRLCGGDIRAKGKIAYASKTGTGPFVYGFDEGTGSAVINQLSPGTNNGAITDGTPVTFWGYDWVPLT